MSGWTLPSGDCKVSEKQHRPCWQNVWLCNHACELTGERGATCQRSQDGTVRLYACNRRVDIDVKHCMRLVFDTRVS